VETPTAVATPATDTAAGRVAAETPPPPPEPLEISDAQVVSLSSSSARIRWRTTLPARTQTSYGLDEPVVWSAGDQSQVEHESVLTGLSFSTTYKVVLHAVDAWDRAQTASLTVTTAGMGDTSAARASGDRILVDDQPFFPRAVWGQCADGFGRNVADGINLFMGDGCGKDRDLAGRLAGSAYSLVDAKTPDIDGRGVIGWYFPDEWDAFLGGQVTPAQLRPAVPAPRSGRISFLTLTNHFYSHAEALPQGKGMYPTLLSIPDVVGFDLYPLQVWCRPAFGDVFEAQRELHALSGGKPTFQWIEVARMEQLCAKHPSLDPTAATVRAETWLAIAGGAGAIGYFPNQWARTIGEGIARTNRQIQELTPALLAPPSAASSDAPAVKVAARALNGALYVIAVNTSQTTVQATLSVDGIAGRSATVVGEGTVVGSSADALADTFAPLAAKVYVVPPQGL